MKECSKCGKKGKTISVWLYNKSKLKETHMCVKCFESLKNNKNVNSGRVKKMRKERIRGLNRRIFRANLKKVLTDDLKYSVEGENLENWVFDYERQIERGSTNVGWYEISKYEHKKGYAEQIRTN